MCGIAGVAGPDARRTPDPVAAALAALAPRGPDGAGRWDGRLGIHPLSIASRRLALVDPLGGRQPCVRPSGSVLVVNGEVYNHEALRRELEGRGETFRTRSDTEVLAALLEREGPDGLARVEGSFALAFWKAPSGPLLLARDPVGVRPLAWTRTSQGFAFASTIDALVATGLVPREPDPFALLDVLRDGVVHGRRSALRDVRRVAPGETITVGSDLAAKSGRIPDPPATPSDPHRGDASAGILEALRAAVSDRLTLDRPACVLLSGGIDSALVAALARDRGRIPAFTVTFPFRPDADEGRRASRTARRLGLEHHEVRCPEDPTPWVFGASLSFDEPFADASGIPTWGLARSAGAIARAALTGTGGDEVFGGYRRYWLLGAGPWLRQVPAFVRAPVAAVLAHAAPQGARLLDASADQGGLYRGLQRLTTSDERRLLVGPRLRDADIDDALPGPTTAAEAMADDRARYLPDDLLVKEDRALMAHALEGRHPFLDRRVAAAASRVELRGSVGRGRQKQVLRAFVREVVDPDLARVSKRGFAFPVDSLYADRLAPLAEDVLGSRSARHRGLVRPDEALRTAREHRAGRRTCGAVIHALVMIELWARRVLDRPPTIL
jgi:asparagine synthase (glutamine-hydrolysing)